VYYAQLVLLDIFVVIRCHVVVASFYCLPSMLYTELFSCSCDADSQMFLFLDTQILTINFVFVATNI